jgi:hypothetical protein
VQAADRLDLLEHRFGEHRMWVTLDPEAVLLVDGGNSSEISMVRRYCALMEVTPSGLRGTR